MINYSDSSLTDDEEYNSAVEQKKLEAFGNERFDFQEYVERLEKEAVDDEGLMQDETHLLEEPTSRNDYFFCIFMKTFILQIKRSKLSIKKFLFKKDQLQVKYLMFFIYKFSMLCFQHTNLSSIF